MDEAKRMKVDEILHIARKGVVPSASLRNDFDNCMAALEGAGSLESRTYTCLVSVVSSLVTGEAQAVTWYDDFLKLLNERGVISEESRIIQEIRADEKDHAEKLIVILRAIDSDAFHPRNPRRKYQPEYSWLDRDTESANAVEELVACAGFTESELRLKDFIRRSGAKDVDAVFAKLLTSGIIKEIPSKSETWKYQVSVVTDTGRKKLHGSLYG